MGAVHKFDLTSDVTHLIVGDHDTPKYKFVAKERSDVKVMLPSWIAAVRASWLEGGVTDVEAAELQHKLPTFHGLRICVTGFDDLVFRKQLEDEITRAGGEYSGNLTKDITHLIAKKPGSEKYEYAKHREIKTVSIEWHNQSLERGMILDEALYHPLLPVSERGLGAWVRRTVSTTSLGKRTRENDGGSQIARKLRRTASAKFETHNDSIWTNIVSAEVKVENARVGDWDDSAQATEGEPVAEMEPEPKHIKVDKSRTDNGTQFLKRSQSMGSLECLLGKPTERGALFQDATFLLQDFDEKKATILARHLSSHGARLISSLSEFSEGNAYLLVPHSTHKIEIYGVHEKGYKPQAVTDLWIERCLHRKRFVDPSENIMSTPLQCFPITGFEKLNVSSTGFQGIDLLHVSKAVNLMGGTYYEYFTEKSTVLICNKVALSHEKLRHAFLWGVPAVKAEWLWECIRNGEMLHFGDYLIQPPNITKEDSGSRSRSEKVAGTCNRDSEVGVTEKLSDQSFRKPVAMRERFAYPQRGETEGKPEPSLGKSLLDQSFPDNAGPRLSTDEARPPPESSAGGKPMASSQAQSPKDKRTPLHETTPNSSPTKAEASESLQPDFKTSSPKHPASISTVDKGQCNNNDDTLGPAISSLLSHRRAARSLNPITAPAPPNTSSHPSQPPNNHHVRRRRRQLLGRAPSNLSSHSIKPSRASSIDTLNTDGLGTPLEATHSHSLGSSTVTAKATADDYHDLPAKVIFDYDHEHDPDRPSQEHLQMTQLGYADPNVVAWRERVAFKMAGGKGTAPAEKGIERGKDGDSGGGKSLGIAKRTRLAVGSRAAKTVS